MTRIKNFIPPALALILASISFPGMAQEHYRYSTELDAHKDWLGCQSDEQCAIVSTHVCHFSFAVNKNYSSQADDFASKGASCTSIPSFRDGTKAKCINKECIMVIPPEKVTLPPAWQPGDPAEWFRCQSDDQCVVAWGGCTDISVNKLYLDKYLEKSYPCRTSDNPHFPDAVAKCQIDTCVVDVPSR